MKKKKGGTDEGREKESWEKRDQEDWKKGRGVEREERKRRKN